MEFIDGDFFEELSKKKNIFYCETHEISKHIDTIDNEIILTHNSDSCLEYIGNDQLKLSLTLTLWSDNAQKKFGSRYKIINIPKHIKKWYGQNLIGNGDKRFVALPIGLERRRWSNGYKHKILLQKFKEENKKKGTLIYLNFKEKNHESRKNLISSLNIPNSKIVRNKINFTEYCSDIEKSKFVLSPTGNGYDCHRTWESLYLGSVPIIKSNNYYDELYSNLPVLLVFDYALITEKLLNEKYLELSIKFTNKTTTEYWENLIN